MGWALCSINHCRLFNAKSCLHIYIYIYIYIHTHTFFWIQFQVLLYNSHNISNLSTHIVCSIWPIDWTFLGATTLGQSGPTSNGNEGVLHILQSTKVGALPSDCLMSYPGLLLLGSYLSAEMQSIYFTAPVDWANKKVMVLFEYLSVIQLISLYSNKLYFIKIVTVFDSL